MTTTAEPSSLGRKELLATLFENYDTGFAQVSREKVQGFLWAIEGRSLDLIERVVKDFVTGKVERSPSRRSKLPTAEEFAAQIKTRAAEGKGCVATPAAVTYAPPFGPLWFAKLYGLLMAGPDKDISTPSSFIASQIAKGGEMGERYRLDHQASNGFRAANVMLQGAFDAKGCTVDETLQAVAELFEPVPVNSRVFMAWKELHRDRGWPWLPEMGRQRVAYLPKGGVDEGLEAVREALAPITSAGPPEPKNVCGEAEPDFPPV